MNFFLPKLPHDKTSQKTMFGRNQKKFEIAQKLSNARTAPSFPAGANLHETDTHEIELDMSRKESIESILGHPCQAVDKLEAASHVFGM
jgi:hypothetical protein